VGAALYVVAALSLAACSSGGDGADGTSPTTTVAAGASTSVTATSDTSGATSAPTLPGEGVGVPGLDDPDAFCAAWAAYSGTVQAIGVAQAFGGLSSVELARLEVAAAAALVAAVDAIGANWPSALVGERSEVLANLVGPFGRRAQRSLSMLLDAGATDLEVEQFVQLWNEALRTRLPDEPVIALAPLPSELDELVRSVAQRFDAAVTPFAQDPSLDVSSVQTPLTDAYLAQQCPDLASSGVGDAV